MLKIMAKKINASKAATNAEYFSLAKCTKVVNVSMEKEGKTSGNEHLKGALALIGKEKFDMTCVTTVGDRMYMGYRDYADTMAVKDGKGVIYTEEVRVNRNGEEYTIHCVEFEDEDYYDATSEDQWDGRVWKDAKEIDGAKRYTPKDCVKGFFAKFESVIRTHNNALEAQRAAAKAKRENDKANKVTKESNAVKKERARLLAIMGWTEEDFQKKLAERMNNELDAMISTSMAV